MKAESFSAPATGLNAAAANIVYRDVAISLRSHIVLWFMRLLLKPLLARIVKSSNERIAATQLQVASMRCPDTAGLALDYRVVGRVPGHVFGELSDQSRNVVLWLHGGAFILPAAPNVHLTLVARLCRDLHADGFVPDYRLAPFNRFPTGLDDCERAYRVLLETGYAPSQIILGGDSAGGNLALGTLQRIRKAGLPMPACAVVVSPVTEMGRTHSPPSRCRVRRSDPLLPIAALARVDELYAGDWDASDPELSPLYMDCGGLPPMFFLATDNEILLDETIMIARRMHDAGVPTMCHVWPRLPHAFVLFEDYFREIRPARDEIVVFARRHLHKPASAESAA